MRHRVHTHQNYHVHRLWRAHVQHTCSMHQSMETLEALPEAIARAQRCHDEGVLLTPTEAMALAGKEAQGNETLFSIARAIASRDEAINLEDLLCDLGREFPHYA